MVTRSGLTNCKGASLSNPPALRPFVFGIGLFARRHGHMLLSLPDSPVYNGYKVTAHLSAGDVDEDSASSEQRRSETQEQAAVRLKQDSKSAQNNVRWVFCPFWPFTAWSIVYSGDHWLPLHCNHVAGCNKQDVCHGQGRFASSTAAKQARLGGNSNSSIFSCSESWYTFRRARKRRERHVFR